MHGMCLREVSDNCTKIKNIVYNQDTFEKCPYMSEECPSSVGARHEYDFMIEVPMLHGVIMLIL